MIRFSPIMALMAATVLAGCGGLTSYEKGPNEVIASARDTGSDTLGLTDGRAAIAYDPDGCQGWIIDDGVEGYSGRRYDAKSGLPVCNNHYPPGTVIRDYQSAHPGVPDYVPRAAAD